MVTTIFFFAAFVLAFGGLFFLKKSDKKLNGCCWIVITLIAETCISGTIIGIVGFTSIPIKLLTISVVFLLIGIVCLFYIWHTKQKQEYEWNVSDGICMGILIVFVFLLCIKTYGAHLNFIFRNSDPAAHFGNAMYVFRNHKIYGMWFAPVYAGTLIEALSVFLPIVSYYKVYILADNLALLMQLLFLFVIMKKHMTNWKRTVLCMILCLIYAGGYPLLNYYMGFFYWGIGILMIEFVLYMMYCYRTQEICRKFCIIFLMAGCTGVFLSYMLFVPAIYVAVLLSLVAVAKKEERIFTWKNLKLALEVFCIPCILGLWYCYFQWFDVDNKSVTDVIAADGGIYKEWYINFLLMLPLVLYYLINRFKEKAWTETVIFFDMIVLFILASLVLVYLHQYSTYYYYKMYYPLWLMFFLILPPAIFELYEKQRSMLMSLVIIAGGLGGLFYGKIESKIVANTTLTPWDHSQQFFDLFYFNDLYSKNPPIYDAGMLEACQYVIENLKNENIQVPLLTDIEHNGYGYWYDAITGKDSSGYYVWDSSLDEIREKMQDGECDYMVIPKIINIYQENMEYFDAYETVFDNECIKLIRVSE